MKTRIVYNEARVITRAQRNIVRMTAHAEKRRVLKDHRAIHAARAEELKEVLEDKEHPLMHALGEDVLKQMLEDETFKSMTCGGID